MTEIRSDIPVSAQFQLAKANTHIRTLEAYLDTGIPTDEYSESYHESINELGTALDNAMDIIWDASYDVHPSDDHDDYLDAYTALSRVRRQLRYRKYFSFVVNDQTAIRRTLTAITNVIQGDDALDAKSKARDEYPADIDGEASEEPTDTPA